MTRRTPAALALLLALAAASLSACNDDDPAGADATDGSTSQSTASDASDPSGPSDSSDPGDAASDPTTKATSPGSPTGDAPPSAAPAGPRVIESGAIGAARVGMTRAQWTATGLFEDGAVLCEGELIHWKGNPPGYAVLTDADATITQLSVSRPGARTKHGGIQVGSTYGELKAAFPSLTRPVADGFDQASVYPPGEEDGLAYLGFLLDAEPGRVTPATKVVSIAVTDGEKPYFQYDC